MTNVCTARTSWEFNNRWRLPISCMEVYEEFWDTLQNTTSLHDSEKISIMELAVDAILHEDPYKAFLLRASTALRRCHDYERTPDTQHMCELLNQLIHAEQRRSV